MKKTKKDKILLALEALLPEKRFHEITLDEVARTAKVGKGTIYRYFEDKEDLFFQLAIRGFDEMCSLLEAHPEPEEGEDFATHLIAVCKRISQFFRERRALLQITNAQEGMISRMHRKNQARWFERRQRLVSALGGVFKSGIENGQISDALPIKTQVRMLLSLLRGRRQMFEDRPEDRPSIEMTVNLFLTGTKGLKK